MNYFVSFELVDERNVVLIGGNAVITGSKPDDITADLEAVKNDHGFPASRIRVLCLTVLPAEV